MKKNNILITGAAGFIGYHIVKKLSNTQNNIIALDNINNYYSQNLKYSRLKNLGFEIKEIKEYNKISNSKIFGEKIKFINLNIEDRFNLNKLFDSCQFDIVCNLAAQAGVRYSLKNPSAYINSNIIGFFNLIDLSKQMNIKRFVYASSSSVYGNSKDVPFSENNRVDRPVSLYAATKSCNELIAHSYSHLFDLEVIGLRFFTVYGPWGRPDMAYFLFTKAILNNQKIDVFNSGMLSRDFTYIDDVINGLENIILIDKNQLSKYRIYNIGNNSPVKLLDFIKCLENKLKISAKKNFLPMQDGDVEITWASSEKLIKDYDYFPNTDLKFGISKFIDWYIGYYNI